MEFAGDIMLQLMIVQRALHALFIDILDVQDLSQHYQVLMVLTRMGGAATQIELISYLKGNESTIRASLMVLEQKGYVMKEKSNRDQRSHLIKVTDKTKDMMAGLLSALESVEQIAFRDIGKERMFELWSALIKINSNALGYKSKKSK